MSHAIHQLIHGIHTIYEKVASTFSGSYSSTHYLNVYEQFSYGFFGVICLAFALLVHINNSPLFYIEKTDTIINYIADIYFRLFPLKDDDNVLPLYTPLDIIKNINNKTVAVDIYDYTIRIPNDKQINTNTVEDV